MSKIYQDVFMAGLGFPEDPFSYLEYFDLKMTFLDPNICDPAFWTISMHQFYSVLLCFKTLIWYCVKDLS